MKTFGRFSYCRFEHRNHHSSCGIHLATGCGPWEKSGLTYQFSAVLASQGITQPLNDWCPKADTNGLAGLTRCGITWARISNEAFSSLASA